MRVSISLHMMMLLLLIFHSFSFESLIIIFFRDSFERAIQDNKP